MTAEDDRAAAFRSQGRRRILNERARANDLGGSIGAHAALNASWDALKVWLVERRDRVPYQPPNPDRPHGIGRHRGGPDGAL